MKKKPVKLDANRDIKGRFLPGSRANPNGRPVGRTLTEEIRALVNEEHPGSSEYTRRKIIALRLVTMAESGDLRAIELVLNYLDGKPRQAIDLDVTTMDWMEMCRANGLSIDDVIREAKQVIAESSVAEGDIEIDSEETIH